MDVQLVRPQPASFAARSAGAAPTKPPEKLPEDHYRPLHLGKTAARVAGWSLPIAGGALGVMAAHSGSAWAGLGVGAPLGLALGLAVGGAVDLMKSLGGSRRGVGRATVICTLLGGALSGGLSAWLVASGAGWGVPTMAIVGGIQGAALGGVIHLLTRSRPTEAQRLVQQINEDPVKYNSPTARPYLDAIYSLEKRGWSVSAEGLMSYQVKPDPNISVSLSKKGETDNDIPVEQLPDLIKVLEGKQKSLPQSQLFDQLGDRPLISQARAQNLPWGGVPGADAKGWWQVERVKAYHDLKDGKALHYAQKEITFTYDPAAPPPLDEFIQDARKTADVYEQSFRGLLDDYTLNRSQGQQLCNTMVQLAESGRYPDLAGAGKAMADWARAGKRGNGEENTRSLIALLAPGRPPDTPALMDQLVPRVGLSETVKASDYLASRLPLLGPSEQSGARDRFVRLTGALGEVDQATRLDGIMGSLSGPVYDGFLGVCEELAKNGGTRKPKDLLFDFAMLGAYATSQADLEQQAHSFGQLLQPLAAAGKADQAAPIFAMLKSTGQPVSAFLAALKSTGDVDKARDQLAPAPGGPPGTESIDPKQFEAKLGWSSHEAASHLEQQQARMDKPSFERYRRNFKRLVECCGDLESARRACGVIQNLPPDRSEVHLRLLEDLARRRGESKPEVMEDYLCAVTGRLPGQSLEEGAREYGELLGGCAGAGYPQEAAPTFALIRAGIASGQAGKDTVRDLTQRYVKSLLLTKDGAKSRLLLFAADSSSSVQEDQGGVTVGGVRIRRRPRE